jgi:hypothetical protein
MPLRGGDSLASPTRVKPIPIASATEGFFGRRRHIHGQTFQAFSLWSSGKGEIAPEPIEQFFHRRQYQTAQIRLDESCYRGQ